MEAERPRDWTVAERIRARFEELTRAERQLANVMLQSYPASALGSITAMADASGVSTPTVARMARKLGFDGFPKLQAALREEVEARLSSPITKHDRWAVTAPATHILNRFAGAVTENLRHTLQQTDPVSFDAAAALLAERARRVHVGGGRITHALADYFFTLMQVVRPGMTLLSPGANLWPQYLLNMQAGDLLVLFDIRRYENDLLHLAELASGKEVTVILFTDQWGSPAAKHAKHSFHARIEAPSAWDSSIVLLFMIEALIAAVESRGWQDTKGRMETLEGLFDRARMFRKFT